jgi:hypothetical protein
MSDFYTVLYEVDHTLTPVTLHTMVSWPGDAAVGDVFMGYNMWITESFNGTTPRLTTYIGLDGVDPGVWSHRDATQAPGGCLDGYTGSGTQVITDTTLAAVSNSYSLLTGPGEWKVNLDNGSGGDPGCTQGSAEFWFHFFTRPSAPVVGHFFATLSGGVGQGSPAEPGRFQTQGKRF